MLEFSHTTPHGVIACSNAALYVAPIKHWVGVALAFNSHLPGGKYIYGIAGQNTRQIMDTLRLDQLLWLLPAGAAAHYAGVYVYLITATLDDPR